MPRPIEARAEEVAQRPAEVRLRLLDRVVASFDADRFACGWYAIRTWPPGTVSSGFDLRSGRYGQWC